MSKNENKQKKHRTHPLYAVVLFLIKIVYTVIYRPRFHGTENIPAKGKKIVGAFVVEFYLFFQIGKIEFRHIFILISISALNDTLLFDFRFFKVE